jgi:transposase
MQAPCNIFIGIDVSKDELVIAYGLNNHWKKGKIPNTLEHISEWLKGFPCGNNHFILEATGPYSERLTSELAAVGASFSVVNPLQSRAMSKALLKTNKTDDQDAQTLSLLGQKFELIDYKMPDNAQKKRKEAFSALGSLQKQERQLKNQLHAFEYRVNPNPVAVKALQDVLLSTQEAIQVLEKELNPEQDEEEARQLIDRIASIKGVGKNTAKVFVTLFGNFQHFDDAKAFAKFVGLSPSEYTSGATIRGRSCITKRGSSKVRALLFNCARSAMRYNENCKELYQRLLEKGKNGKVALTAVMHKLARLIFGVVRSGIDYNPQFASLKIKNP